MFVTNMKQLFIILFISLFALIANAQKVHFVYLQTENGKPFYVKLNNNVMSSSQTGYVIIPNLIDGTYQLVVGFPKNEFPEEKFNLTIENKNEGFLVKNFDEKGWALFNLQSLALINNSGQANSVVTTSNIQSNAFSDMLANVVKDSSILQKSEPVVAAPKAPLVQEKVDSNASSAVSNTSTVVINTPPAGSNISSANSNISSVNSNISSVASIRRVLSVKEKDGMEMIYVDSDESKTDTVRIFMPFMKKGIKKEDKVVVENKGENMTPVPDSSKNVYAPPVIDSSQLTITPTIINSDADSQKNISPQPVAENKILAEGKDSSVLNDSTAKKPLIVETAKQAEIDKTTESTVILKTERTPATDSAINQSEVKSGEDSKKNEIIVLPKAATSSIVNSDCKGFASDADFLKLRKRMAAENNDDDMLNAAKRLFKTKCFTTEQIKNLSYLFLNDEGKYKFFDAAYAYTSDSDQYGTLQSQLRDEYYINRFKAMIHP